MNAPSNPEFDGFNGREIHAGGAPVNAHPGTGGNGEGSLATILQAAFGACMGGLQDLRAWRRDVTALLGTINRTALASVEAVRALSQGIARVESAMHKDTASSAAPPAAVARLESQLGQLTRVSAADTHDLEQVRLQTEGLARNFEKLSQDFIQRQVLDPCYVAFARLYEAVFSLTGRNDLSDVDLQPILQRIRGFLEDCNVELIHPDDGEPLDPRRHQPVKQLANADASLHGRIASTFNVGLVHGTRVIQAARVEVFIFTDTPSANSTKP